MKKYLTFNTADIEVSLACFFDSFIKLMIAVGIMISILGLSPEYIYKEILPQVGLSIVILQIFIIMLAYYYAKDNNKIISLPNGISSERFFVWLFAIIIPTYTTTKDPILAIATAVGANLISSTLTMILSFLSSIITKYIPKAALFACIAGTSLAWLILAPLQEAFKSPFIAIICFFFMLMCYLANIKTKPPVLIISMIIGIIITFANSDTTINESLLKNVSNSVYLPSFIYPHLIVGVKKAIEFLPIIIAISIIELVAATQAIEQATNINHNYKNRIVIFFTGLASFISSLIGNPFPLNLFWGYSTWVKINATKNFPIILAMIFFIICITPIATIFINLIPLASVLPIIVFIGIISFSDAFKSNDIKYFDAMIIALSLPLFNFFAVNLATKSPLNIEIISHGSALLSILWGSVFIFIIDKKYLNIAVITLLCAILSFSGLIHFTTLFANYQIPLLYISMSLIFLVIHIFKKLKFRL